MAATKGKRKGPDLTARSKGGRPTKCTKDFLDDFEVLLLGGGRPKTAFLALGPSSDSWDRWQERGAKDIAEKKDTPYSKFCLILSRAHSLAKVSVDTKMHRNAATGDVSAARLWYQRQQVEGFEPQNSQLPGEGPIDDDDTIRAALAKRVAHLTQSPPKG